MKGKNKWHGEIDVQMLRSLHMQAEALEQLESGQEPNSAQNLTTASSKGR